MSNRLAILAVLFAGCSGEQSQDLRPFVAVAGNYSLMAADVEPVMPYSDKCRNCRGKGKVGDGRVMVTCARCNGTGVEQKAEQPPEAPVTAAPPPPHQSQPSSTATIKCKDGKCPTVIVR